MPYFESLRHVVKNSMGVTYCIWYKNGLFMSMLESDNHWGPPFLLSENATPDFSVSIGQDDTIRSSFVDYAGRLLFVQACEERKEPVVLLESRIVGSAPYSVVLSESKNATNVFYVVSHNRKQLLTYQRIENGSLTMPEVEGVIVRGCENFSACSDGSSTHLFFLTEIQDVNLIVHRRINSEGKAMKPNSAPFPHKVSKRLQSVTGKGKPIYVLLSGGEDDESTLLYRFDPETNRFSKGLEVFNPSTTRGFDSLIMVDNYPSVVRTCNSHMLLARVNADASSVLAETKFDLTTTNPPLRCRYLSNYKDDINFACADLPIIFGSGLRFPLDWRTYASGKFEKSNDEKDLLQGRIKELEGRVEFLENTLREMLRP